MKVTIGSLVLCYLLAPGINENNQNNGQEQPQEKIIKVWGKVVDFKERDALYDKDKNTPIAYVQRVDDFIIRGINRKGIYQVNVNACKPVKKIPKGAERTEFEEVRLDKEKIEVEIDENYNVVEKNDLEAMNDGDQEAKKEKIKALIEEKRKEDQELKRLYLKEQRAKQKALEEAEKVETKKDEVKESKTEKEGKDIENKGVFDYLLEKNN